MTQVDSSTKDDGAEAPTTRHCCFCVCFQAHTSAVDTKRERFETAREQRHFAYASNPLMNSVTVYDFTNFNSSYHMQREHSYETIQLHLFGSEEKSFCFDPCTKK